VDQTAKTNVVLLDALEAKMREFAIGGTIATIAGNGLDAFTDMSVPSKPAVNNSLKLDMSGVYNDDLAVRRNDGVVYFRSGASLITLNRQTGFWERIAGTGSKSWLTTAADNQPGADVSYAENAGIRPLGMGAQSMLLVTGRYPFNEGFSTADAHRDAFMFEHSLDASATLRRRAGAIGKAPSDVANQEVCNGVFESPGVFGNAIGCTIMSPYQSNRYSNAHEINLGNQGPSWIYGHLSSRNIYHLDVDGKLKLFATLSSKANGFAYRPATTSAPLGTIYYCDGTNLRKHVVGSATTDSTLNIGPSSRVRCGGREMHWVNDRLMFIYNLNYLSGFAEIIDP
jgi:hypothetical protein